MPEGDTLHRTAATLRRALVGHSVTRFDSAFPHLLRMDEDHGIVGRQVGSVESRGKHLLIDFEPWRASDLVVATTRPCRGAARVDGEQHVVLRSHMRMSGSWHVYRPGERWQRAPSHMRVLIETAPFVAVAFDVHDAACAVVEGEGARAGRSSGFAIVDALGPDVLAPDFDQAEATRRACASRRATVSEVLLDQREVAGIGNVFKSEVLFLARWSPFAEPARLDARAWGEVWRTARELMQRNAGAVRSGAFGRARSSRITTGRLDPSAALWVYGRAGRACRVCGTAISYRRLEPGGRSTYWCARCQHRGAPFVAPIDEPPR